MFPIPFNLDPKNNCDQENINRVVRLGNTFNEI